MEVLWRYYPRPYDASVCGLVKLCPQKMFSALALPQVIKLPTHLFGFLCASFLHWMCTACHKHSIGSLRKAGLAL